MQFLAELKTVGRTKQSLDNVYTVKFETDNPMVLDLGKLKPMTMFVVKVEIDD